MKIAMISMRAARGARIAELATELGRQGHDVTIYTRSEGRRTPQLDQVTVECLPAGPERPLEPHEEPGHVADFGRLLAARWATEKPDVVHAHGWTSGLAALSAQSHDLVVPVVQTYVDVPDADSEWVRLERAVGRTVGAVIAGCVEEQNALVELGLPRPRVAVIPAGVDTDTFADHGPAYPRGDRARLLMMCGPDLKAGVAQALRMLARVPEAELVIAGGPDAPELDDDRHAAGVRAVARKLGVEDRVILLGRVDRPNVPQLLRSADLVLSLALAEPYGQIVLEAMACGLPVVASDTGSHLDMVVEGVTGLLVKPDRPVELAKKIRALLADRTRRTALGIAGADRARSRHAWDRIAAETVAVYERV